MPERPTSVPDDAWWSPNDNEWILGAKDRDDRLVGVVRYWRPDGSLVCECDHADGVPHGTSHRYHETGEVAQRCAFERGQLHGLRAWFMTDGVTTEKPRAAELPATIWRGELDYVHGRVVAFRYYDREGREVGPDGTPLPQRPANVPAAAQRRPKSNEWFLGVFDEAGDPVGLVRRWTGDGALYAEENHEGGAVATVMFRRDGSRHMQFTRDRTGLTGEATA